MRRNVSPFCALFSYIGPNVNLMTCFDLCLSGYIVFSGARRCNGAQVVMPFWLVEFVKKNAATCSIVSSALTKQSYQRFFISCTCHWLQILASSFDWSNAFLPSVFVIALK